MQCGVELLVSNSRTPPHCEGHSARTLTHDFSVHHRDGETMVIHRLYHTVDMGVAMSLPRGGYRLLSPAREYGGECSCEVGTRSNNEGALRE